MAGPEDRTTCSHHHGNPQDTSSNCRFLHTTYKEEDSLLKENNNPLTVTSSIICPSSTSQAMGRSLQHTTSDTVLKPDEHLRVGLREGQDSKLGNVQKLKSVSSEKTAATSPTFNRNMPLSFNPPTFQKPPASQNSALQTSQHSTLQTSQNSTLKTSRNSILQTSQSSSFQSSSLQSPQISNLQPVCQDDDESLDVFDLSSHHPHFFFMEDDDNDSDDDSEETDLWNDAFEDSNRDLVEEDDDIDHDRFSRNVENGEDADDGQSPGQSYNLQDVSSPGSSPLAAVCRQSHGSQVAVLCQIQNPGTGNLKKISSCPSIFSPLWTQIMPAVPAQRRRGSMSVVQAHDKEQHIWRVSLNTGAGEGTPADSQWPSSPRQQELGQDLDLASQQEDYSYGSLRSRGRSFSESDVQQLLITEMSKELRRMGDEFNRSRGRRLTAFSEPIAEESSALDM